LKDYFGLDIGYSSIKLVHLVLKDSKILLSAIEEAEIPLGLVESDSDASKEELSEAVKNLVQKANLSTPYAVISLSSNKAMFNIFDFPDMGSDELSFAMKYEIAYRFNIPRKDYICDWQVLKRNPNRNIKLFTVAVPKVLSDRYVKIINNAGLFPLSVDMECLSLVSALKDLKKNLIIVHIGHSYSIILLLAKGELRSVKVVGVGGGLIENQLVKDFQISLDKTENFGLNKGKLDGHVYGSIKASLGPLFDEIKQVIGSAQLSYTEIDKIVLSGGLALMPGSIEEFSSVLFKNVVKANPLNNIELGSCQDKELISKSPKFSVAVGLALTFLMT
jgi:type IV pilus assembly protein PilM